MDNIDYVKPKNSLRKKEKQEKLKKIIVARVNQIQNYQQLRANNNIDQELILLVCNCVENLVKKKYNIDKKQFVVDILSAVFPSLSQIEIDNIKNVVQFLFDNLLIQVVPILDKSKYIAWAWIKRKFL